VTAALLLAQGAIHPAAADITANAAPDSAVAVSGAYTQEDSKALLRVLEAPGRSPAVDSSFEASPEFLRGDVTSLPNGPRSLEGLALEPESKRFEAWDMKGGTIVPEPATALLMGAGLAALAVFRGLRGRAGIK
jgi:hypothetical protein